ncbi:MAG: hypothetical protein CME21_21340 [Gemmatimonadetes bacterium]|nr:hypothetical protein [Gemmatimonadota bacterium]|tara:strand:+ start:189 stop:572 length:384 start_codon:yes stop_codon:yes gene_type:complete
MKSAYVSCAYKNIPAADATSKQLLIDLSSSSSIRLFSVHFVPAAHSSAAATSASSGVEIYGSDPDGGDSPFYEEKLFSGFYTGFTGFWNLNGPRVDPHGVFFSDASDIYVKGVGVGIAFVSITYQLG